MITAQDLKNTTDLREIDAIIAAATERKQALADAKTDAVFTRLAEDCAELDISPKQLVSLFNKWQRKSRASHKDNGSEE